MEPQHYVEHADKIQEVSIENFLRSTHAYPKKIIKLIPHFDENMEVIKQPSQTSERDFRTRYSLGHRKILLNVGVLARTHKRTDHLLKETTDLPPDWMILVCGGIGDPTIIDEGEKLLGDRFRHLNLSPSEMSDAYQNASLLVHCATTEGFGIVIIEAMKFGLPVLIHDNSLFRWIIHDPEQIIDMAIPGRLRQKLKEVSLNPGWLKKQGEKNYKRFLKTFTWKALKKDYIQFIFNE
jgi:glycosyltransferase involved in cell wall biosynthesis